MKYHVTGWGWFWLTWMATALVVEIYWVLVNSYNTLSDQIWGLERIDVAHPLAFSEWTPLHWAIALCLWAFFAWLCVHFPFGYLR